MVNNNSESWDKKISLDFENWFNKLPKPLAHKLDFSYESIIPLEKEYMRIFLRNKILNNIDFNKELDYVRYYVGEVFIKNAPMKMIRVSKSIESTEYRASVTPFFERIFLLSKADVKDGYNEKTNYLYDFCIEQQEVFEKVVKHSEYRDDFALAIRLDDNYQYFLLHETDTNPLPKIKTLLKEYFSTHDNPPKLSYHRDSKDYLIIEMSDYYCFHFKFKQGDRVKKLIQEMLEKDYSGELNKKEIAQCQSTTEFWGDEDPEIDYMNEALWMLQEISELPEIVTILDINTGEELLFS